MPTETKPIMPPKSVLALECAEQFLERVETWTGTDECERDEVLEEVRAALAEARDA